MPPPDYVVIAAVVMVALNVLAILATVVAKALRRFRGRRRRGRRKRLEPALYEFLATGEVSPVLREEENRDFLASLVVEILAQMRGSEGERLVGLARELGLVERDLRLLDSSQRWYRAKAAENLGYYGGPEAARPAGALLDDQDETVRAVAARALSRIGTGEAAQALATRLASPSELTSLRMAENLERVGPLAVRPLVELLESEEREERRAQVLAARVLGNLRVLEARPALCQTLRRRWNTDLRAQAALALGKIGNPEDLPAILEAAGDDSWPVRAQAANALGKIGAPSSVPTLEKLAADEEWWVRRNAGRALVNMGPGGEYALARLLEGPDRFARDRAAAAMEERGVTRRLVGELTEPGERGVLARRIIRARIRAGETRYLRRLSETLPQEAGREALQEMLSGVARES